MEGKYDAAKQAAGQFADIFGSKNFYLEIQNQGLEQEQAINPALHKLARELDLPLVATNDSHYLCEDDWHAQDVMVCIQTGKYVQDTNRMKFQTRHFYVKSAEEMLQMFSDTPEVLQPHPGDRRALQPEAGENPQSLPAFRRSRRASRSTAISNTSRAKALRAG